MANGTRHICAAARADGEMRESRDENDHTIPLVNGQFGFHAEITPKIAIIVYCFSLPQNERLKVMLTHYHIAIHPRYFHTRLL